MWIMSASLPTSIWVTVYIRVKGCPREFSIVLDIFPNSPVIMWKTLIASHTNPMTTKPIAPM